MGTEKPYIVLWRELAEQALSWENSGNWGDYDFEKLSELIFEKTQTRLSLSTLKRIWGKVRYDNTPTVITLNALARFLDFADWRSFKKQAELNKVKAPAGEPLQAVKRRKLSVPVIFTIAGLAVAAYLVLSLAAKRAPAIIANAPVKFSARVVSDKMPNSVVFDYDASAYHSDSVYIQQSWDPKRREKVAGDGKQHTSIYYVPGYFNAKLVINGRVKKEQPVFIKTNGWLGLIDKDPVPTYLNNDSIHMPGALGITARQFEKIKGAPVFNGSAVYFYNLRDFDGLASDNFNFETTLRNTSLPEQSSCRKVLVEIIGTKNAIDIPLCDKGCIAELQLSTGDKYISGKTTDLSAFGCDFANFQHLACVVQNHKFTVSLNGKEIFTTAVNQNIGKIAGIRIGFEGPGEIKDVKLGDDKRVVYSENFSGKRVLAAGK